MSYNLGCRMKRVGGLIVLMIAALFGAKDAEATRYLRYGMSGACETELDCRRSESERVSEATALLGSRYLFIRHL